MTVNTHEHLTRRLPALFLAGALSAPVGALQHAISADDDRQILSAVMQQSVTPYVALEREIADLPARPVVVVARSLRGCPGSDIAPPDCADVSLLTTPDGQGFIAGAWDYREETRAALVASFARRNRGSEPLPVLPSNDVVTHPDRERAIEAAGVGALADLVIELALPGYSSNGFALVYGQSSREGRPLQGWAFVLSHASGRWVVQHAYLLWIRQ
jgi:hypothetical protein